MNVGFAVVVITKTARRTKTGTRVSEKRLQVSRPYLSRDAAETFLKVYQEQIPTRENQRYEVVSLP